MQDRSRRRIFQFYAVFLQRLERFTQRAHTVEVKRQVVHRVRTWCAFEEPYDNCVVRQSDGRVRPEHFLQIEIIGAVVGANPFPQAVTVDGNTWTTSAEIPYKGKTIIYRDVYVFQSSDKRTTTTQISADNGKTWTTITEFTAVQVAP